MTLPRRSALASLLLGLSSGVLAACSPVRIVNALVPGSGYRRIEAVPYGEGPRRRLDLYVPDGLAAPAPVVVFFYGGNWQTGERGDYLFAGQALASRGYVTVIPDYTLYPAARYPVFLEDCAAAVRWTMANIGLHGGDAARIAVMGHSAGAYNAAMLALDGRWLGRDRTRLGALVGLAGPYDFLPLSDPALIDLFAPEQPPRAMLPITQVSAPALRTLLVAGLDDTTVDPANSKRLAARLRSAGAEVVERYYENLGHVRLAGALAAPLRFTAPVLDDVDAFLRAGAATRPPAV
jgi:acetyl esterase/lipase